MPVVKERFNLVVDEEAWSDLGGVYVVLVGGDGGAIGPFAESGEAVSAFESGDIAALCLHDIPDIRCTAALAELSE